MKQTKLDKLKAAVKLLREVQCETPDNGEHYKQLDEVMYSIEDMIDEAEDINEEAQQS
jgi:hypothetical protein